MSVAVPDNGNGEIRVTTGGEIVLRVRAYDPSGIKSIFIQCYQFSMANSSRMKVATGEIHIPLEQSFQQDTFDVPVYFPENAAFGKWGIQLIEFTNGRGYKSSFYRGHGKFDNINIVVVPPPSKEDELLRFNGVEVASSRQTL